MKGGAERGTVEEAAAILGLPQRTVQDLAARGEIPGAAKFGRRWTFDIPKLRWLVKQRERQTCQDARRRQDATGAPALSTAGSKFVAGTSDGRFTQLTRRLRARYKAARERLIGDAYHGDSPRTFVEAMEGWATWIERRRSPKTMQRYACSLDQLQPFIEGKRLSEIDGHLVAEIIRARAVDGVTNATIRRDLVALSSVINYAIDQGWLESNPVLARMKRIEERRDPIMLPRQEDIDLVLARAPGMIKDMIHAAMTMGAREAELLRARRDEIDHDRKQMTLIGKRNKRRTIDLEPFDAYDLLRSLPSYVGTPLLFWHSDGARYKNFASQFSAIINRTAKWAADNEVDFRPFTFHSLRHWHAVHWLKSGRSLYELQHRLGHSSIKVTEGYLRCGYLTFEEQQAAMAGARIDAVPGGEERAA